MTSRTKKPRSRKQERHPLRKPNGPLTTEQMAILRDIGASKPVPKDIHELLARDRVTVTLGRDSDQQDWGVGPRENRSQREVVLPTGSFIGSAITKMKLHKPRSIKNPRNLPEPGCPDWQSLFCFPRPSTAPVGVLRRKRGTQVVLTDTGMVYGEYPARQTFYPTGYPWQCIGRVNVWNDASQTDISTYGSAVLIGRRAVVTAGHVVPWGAGNPKMQFIAGYYDGNSTSGPGGQSWVTEAHGYDPNNHVVAHDMAVLRLADPLGSALGYFGAMPYDDSWEGGNYWSLVGYPTAVTSERPSWQGGISVLDDDEDGDAQELEHHGDDTGGDSGGPFFGWWTDGPYVIGTVSGHEHEGGFLGIAREDNNIVAGGTALINLVAYARDQFLDIPPINENVHPINPPNLNFG